ncbi:hypothetical protein TRIATDRAFT_299812 [Trichoderma atroviride IMI 206040]|uniref:Uncharacterized protein n=1 Tax=Hypocrea atroviridis (strain ATCC 20476 / IMI 206040) TaxID=452589 RepID=G9NVN6_HYPAI|nr:uncharacterized protein TRIATDRAFT_299812 [Trichoderma atroviride IMI 206040]EHK45055.1 hypothetical protein TRIATDRAFT_299812 [Trichoderma atroviride IMI 206040]
MHSLCSRDTCKHTSFIIQAVPSLSIIHLHSIFISQHSKADSCKFANPSLCSSLLSKQMFSSSHYRNTYPAFLSSGLRHLNRVMLLTNACKLHKTDFSTKTCIIRLAALASPQIDASNVSSGWSVTQKKRQNAPIVELTFASSCVVSHVFFPLICLYQDIPTVVSDPYYMYTTQPPGVSDVDQLLALACP